MIRLDDVAERVLERVTLRREVRRLRAAITAVVTVEREERERLRRELDELRRELDAVGLTAGDALALAREHAAGPVEHHG